ncbi:MAG: Exopolysaccharide synthesis, ExoD [Cypionkella sp.]|uniref:exopolysaccharide biosynthesis protein n=1 Tax=Cypionkella sp. TaxID=2811411 RepID=UPI00261E890A|nr:exopolysaccharide biosynthesis protein [Cypionkella sp.]MDB5660291.1 Exopolysaccharide synthesis, ExoD [Cypionkella sp.]
MPNPQTDHIPLSKQLLRLVQSGTSERVSLGDLVSGIKTHARATLLILFAIPNLLPGLPGTSAVTGLPLVYLTLQMMLGRPAWLPGFIANRSLSRANLLAILTRAAPYLARVEKVLHPRLPSLTSEHAQRIMGAVGILLSLLVMLPIPFGNFFPALAILIAALGLLGHDGYFILTAAIIAIAAVVMLVAVYWALIAAVIYMAFSTTA